MEGLRRWLLNNGSPDLWQQYLQREERSIGFKSLISTIREKLRLVYASALDDDQKQIAKEQILTLSLADYEVLKKSWDGYDGFDTWMSTDLNNARLSSLATYYELVPAFQALLRQSEYDLNEFYTTVKALEALSKSDRLAKLNSLSLNLQTSFK